MKNKILTTVSLLCICIFALSFRVEQQPSAWKVPDNYLKMANPDKATPASITSGKSLFVKYCVECHGKKGTGNGPKSTDLKTSPADMTKSSFQSQSDGSLFYKISEGRNEMPKFKKEITDPDDIWSIVNYVRTLK